MFEWRGVAKIVEIRNASEQVSVSAVRTMTGYSIIMNQQRK